MPTSIIFWLGFSCLLLHELDAIDKAEWKLFPILKNLPDQLAYQWFAGLHLPLFAFFLYKLTDPSSAASTMTGFSVFFVLHLVAHLVLWRLPDNRFNNIFSQSWIWGAAMFGCWFLLVS